MRHGRHSGAWDLRSESLAVCAVDRPPTCPLQMTRGGEEAEGTESRPLFRQPGAGLTQGVLGHFFRGRGHGGWAESFSG